jgi:DNA-binding NarL/FixJ family response regulator
MPSSKLTKKAKILVFDEQPLFSEGLRLVLSTHAEVEVIGLSADLEDLFRKLKSYYVDVLIIDFYINNAENLALIHQIRRSYPGVKVMVLTMSRSLEAVQHFYKDHVEGYLLKTANLDEFSMALRKILEGNTYYSQEVLGSLVAKHPFPSLPNTPSISPREKEVLALIVAGNNNQRIAEILSISLETVSTHRKSLLKKLNVNNTASLVRLAIHSKIA